MARLVLGGSGGGRLAGLAQQQEGSGAAGAAALSPCAAALAAPANAPFVATRALAAARVSAHAHSQPETTLLAGGSGASKRWYSSSSSGGAGESGSGSGVENAGEGESAAASLLKSLGSLSERDAKELVAHLIAQKKGEKEQTKAALASAAASYLVPPIPDDLMPSVEELLQGEGDDVDEDSRNKNAEVRILPRQLNKFGHAYGLGKRKSAVARAWLKPGTGQITVNNVPASEYFAGGVSEMYKVSKPLAVTATLDAFDVHCTVRGGGTTGQADAVSLAISRAIQHFDPPKRVALKVYDLLTRDSREVERKKPGRAKARKAFQWVKR